ncbi:MAG: hypothetical protein QOG33_1521 [Gaiellales bacterium]|jgi:hypothetical protein|nr:hypothetical protein [Gaiellales bacterium]
MTRTELRICRWVAVFTVIWMGLFVRAELQAPSGANWGDTWDFLPPVFLVGWVLIAPIVATIAGTVEGLVGSRAGGENIDVGT